MIDVLSNIKYMVSNYDTIVESLQKYFQMKADRFEAGRLRHFANEWQKITSDKNILQIVTGVKLEFLMTPTKQEVISTNYDSGTGEKIESEIQSLFKKGVITKCADNSDLVRSPIFLRDKKDGKFRLILNLRHLNESIAYHHFKMDTLKTVIQLLTKNCYMASIDLKDAYYTVPIHKDFQKYLAFAWDDEIYVYTCLPNGLGPAPRLFTKLLKPPIHKLHKAGHILSAYIDDIYLQGSSFEECAANVADTIICFDKLGFIIHPTKSEFIPRQSITFLGFILDSTNMTVRPNADKIGKVTDTCKRLLAKNDCTIRELASAIGLLVSCFPGIAHGPLYYRELEHNKVCALKAFKGDFNKHTNIYPMAIVELKWWVSNIKKGYKCISQPPPSIIISTDASMTGWGAIWNDAKIGGHWNDREARHHINYLELLAVYNALTSFFKDVKSMHIRIYSDNTTAVCSINNMGTSHSPTCNSLVRKIWLWAIERDIWVSTAHIPGVLNIEADKKSREKPKDSEWKLDRGVFEKAVKHFDFYPEIDLFASRHNFQVDKYVSFTQDPEAHAIDAFSMSWKNLKFYAFPPFSIILPMLQKIQQEQAQGLCVCPDWPTQSWYPIMTKMLLVPPLHIKHSKTLLKFPNFPKITHPLHKKLDLLICLLSGNI